MYHGVLNINSSLLFYQQRQHPAPLPEATAKHIVPKSNKLMPPKPGLKLSRVLNGEFEQYPAVNVCFCILEYFVLENIGHYMIGHCINTKTISICQICIYVINCDNKWNSILNSNHLSICIHTKNTQERSYFERNIYS